MEVRIILAATGNQNWGVEAWAGKSGVRDRPLGSPLMDSLPTIRLKAANAQLAQAEDLRLVFPIPWPKGAAEVSCLACDARLLRGLQRQLCTFSSTLSTGIH